VHVAERPLPQTERQYFSPSALAWFESEQYRPLRDLRRESAETVVSVADGVPETASAG